MERQLHDYNFLKRNQGIDIYLLNPKEKIHFYRYSYGSLKETQDWIRKAKERGLINERDAIYLAPKLEQLPKLINHLIKYTNEKLKY